MRALPFAAILVATPVAADPITTVERPGHWTEATTLVDATPAEVYEFATDYAMWPKNLSDVTAAKVQRGGRETARVEFTSRAFEHTLTVQFDNLPNRALRFVGVKGPPGTRAKGEYIVDPIDGGKRSRITARLYVDVVGVPSLFVRDSTIRHMRQSKLRADLGDTVRWAQSRRPSS